MLRMIILPMSSILEKCLKAQGAMTTLKGRGSMKQIG